MPPEFNPSFQSPDWGWWIVLYFFLGGITGGVYFAAAWLDLFGDARDQETVRLAYLLAFPLLVLCALLLIVDLGRPERFPNMIFQSERFPLLVFKPWSPMSLGSAILAVVGAIGFLLFLDALLARGRPRRLRGGLLGKLLAALVAVAGLALAGYTGALLSVTNEPVWTDSSWISALFVFSGVSTGIATILLVARRAPRSTVHKLEEADNYLMGLELLTLGVFLATLGAVGTRFVLGSPVLALYLVVIVVGLLAPLALHLWPRLGGGGRPAGHLGGGVRRVSTAAALLVLVGGFVLRWAVLAGPQGVGL